MMPGLFSDDVIESLLGRLATSFRLDRRIGGEMVGRRLEEIMREAAGTETVDFGSSGDPTELRRDTDGIMHFHYRPHLFPGMDPALRLGHLVQYHLLPRELPSSSPVDGAALLESYCHLSGDLFGWKGTPDGGLNLWLLDVSGHGVRAGFAAVIFKLILSDIDPSLPLPTIAGEAERRFIETRVPEDPRCIFATGVLLRIHRHGRLEYLSAGHPPMLVRRRSGSVQRFEATTVPLALFPEIEPTVAELVLDRDESLFICTDGLLELRNSAEQDFGIDATAEILASSDGTPQGICSSLIEALGRFHELDRLEDDLSFIAVRLRH
jgi:sigma-B regulation protein RsbU (phosphoserine phosphatase)